MSHKKGYIAERQDEQACAVWMSLVSYIDEKWKLYSANLDWNCK